MLVSQKSVTGVHGSNTAQILFINQFFCEDNNNVKTDSFLTNEE